MIGNLGQMNVLITATDRASDDIRSVQGQMKGAAQTAQSLGTGLAAAGAVGVAAAGAAVNEYSQFEDQMIEVQKVTGATDEEIKGISERLKNMSAGPLPASAEELGKIAAQAGSVGIRGEENIAKFTRSVQKMAIATRLSSQEAAEQIAKISNAFEIPMTQAENLGSSINALANSTASWADEISQGVRRAAGAASTLGISAQETSGIIATLVDNGMRSRRAGTRMRRVFTQMSTEADKMAKVLGTSTKSVKKSIEEDAVGTLTRFIEKAKETGNTQEIFSDTFGSAGKAALDMLTDVDELQKNIKKSEEAFKENTSLQEEYENALSSVSNQVQNTIDKFKAIMISMGGELAPMIKSTLLPAVNGVLDAFRNLDKGTKGLIATILGLGGVAALVTGAAVVLGSVIATLSAPVIGLGLAVAGVIGFFAAFQKNLFGVRDAIMKMFKVAKPLINGMIDLFQFFIGDTIEGFGRLVKAAGWFIENVTQPIYQILQPAIKNIGTAIILAIHTAGKVLKSGRKLFGDFVEGVTQFFDGLVTGIVDGINFALEKVIDFINMLIEKANSASKALGQGKITGKLSNVTLGGMAESLQGDIQKQRDEMDKMRTDLASQIGGSDAEKQVSAFQDMVEMGVSNIDDVGRAVQEAGDSMIGTGEDIKNADISVTDLQSALSGGKSGKKGAKTAEKKEQKKQTKELKKLRKMMEKQDGESGGINIQEMKVNSNNPEDFEKKLRKEASASGIYQ